MRIYYGRQVLEQMDKSIAVEVMEDSTPCLELAGTA